MKAERRKLTRLSFKNPSYIIFRPGFLRLARIIDITKEGMGFEYFGYAWWMNDSMEIDIFLPTEGHFYIPRIDFKIIYDFSPFAFSGGDDRHPEHPFRSSNYLASPFKSV